MPGGAQSNLTAGFPVTKQLFIMKTKSIETNVLVFRTNIRHQKDLFKVAFVLNPLKQIHRWNVDRKDIDNVLRIESTELAVDEVNELVRKAGFSCEELED